MAAMGRRLYGEEEIGIKNIVESKLMMKKEDIAESYINYVTTDKIR